MLGKQPTASALKAQAKRDEADKALAHYRARDVAIDENTARLRALRLAREAEGPPIVLPPRKSKRASAKTR